MNNQTKTIGKFLAILSIFLFVLIVLIYPRPASAIQASLSLAHNDGAQCFVNNQKVWDNITAAHANKYWNRTINVSDYLQVGQNVLACWVSNGDGNQGSGRGYFDAQLIVNQKEIVLKGDDWKYFGSGGSIAPPPLDNSGRVWYHPDYLEPNWLTGKAAFRGTRTDGRVLTRAPDSAWFRKSFNLDNSFSNHYYQSCSVFNNRVDCINRAGCAWTGSHCVDSSFANCSLFTNQIDCIDQTNCTWTGSSCVATNMLGCSAFTLRTACLSIPHCVWTGSYCLAANLATCNLFNNQTDCSNRPNCTWTSSGCVITQSLYDHNLLRVRALSLTGCSKPTIHRFDKYSVLPANANNIVIESATPLITGLLKYGNQIEFFVNDQSIGQGVVKEGETTGVANFYFKPKQNIAAFNNNLDFNQLKIVATNPHDKSTCVTGSISFIVTPYPAPIIHLLGEINYVQRANALTISNRKPLITGLVRYGSIVEIFVNDKMVGRPRVKEGERSGVANFYMTIPELKPGEYTLYAIAKKAGQEDIQSRPSQVYNFTVR